jgi:hypothetical protein
MAPTHAAAIAPAFAAHARGAAERSASEQKSCAADTAMRTNDGVPPAAPATTIETASTSAAGAAGAARAAHARHAID